jgi:ankyrin repeat protein
MAKDKKIEAAAMREREEESAMLNALDAALCGNAPKLLDLLLSRGVSDRIAETAARICANYGCVDMLGRVLEEKKNWSDENYSGSVLRAAATQKDEAFVEPGLPGRMVAALLKAGAPVDARDSSGLTALQSACAYAAYGAAKALVDAGANLEAKRGGSTPMLLAAEQGDARFVRLLAGAGAKVDARNAKGESALLLAVQRTGRVALDLVEALLAAGAKVDLKDKSGKTAAIWAAESGDARVMGALIAAGADIGQTRESDGKSLVEIAFGEEAAQDRETGACGEALVRAGARIPSKVRLPLSKGESGKSKMGRFSELVKKNGFGASAGLVESAWDAQEIAKAAASPKTRKVKTRSL